MSDQDQQDHGGPAFPHGEQVVEWPDGKGSRVYMPQQGMTLRDWFAGQALAGLNANITYRDEPSVTLAIRAYEQADAMLAARKEAGHE